MADIFDVSPAPGDYGVTVNIEVCGTFDSGSIPDSRPGTKIPFGDFCVGAGVGRSVRQNALRESKSFCGISGACEQKYPKGVLKL